MLIEGKINANIIQRTMLPLFYHEKTEFLDLKSQPVSPKTSLHYAW
jgi:hypothetical protein